jgi:hypothetical protein
MAVRLSLGLATAHGVFGVWVAANIVAAASV